MSLLKLALAGLCTLSCAFAGTHRLTVVYSSVSQHSSSVFLDVKQEASRLVAGANFGLEWIVKNSPQLRSGEFDNIVVVNFAGNCAVESNGWSVPPASEARSLATTAISDGHVLPFVRVDCDRTLRMISPGLTNLPPAARNRAFGKALGRVVAHELYHVLANSIAHQRSGVSKPCFRPADLLAESFHFDEESVARMQPSHARVTEVAELVEGDGDEVTGR